MRRDLYSNSSPSSHARGGTWIYINGELYHAGVKGMHWYQHLPGTTWWKEKTNENYKNAGVNIPKRTFGQRVAANLKTAGQYLTQESQYYRKRIPEKIKGSKAYQYGKEKYEKAKFHLNAFKQDPKEYVRSFYKAKWSNVRSAIEKYYKNSQGHSSTINSQTPLDTIVAQQLDGAWRAYAKAQKEGGFFNYLNSVIETTEHNIVSGANKFLKDNGWDDNVDALLKKLNIKF